MGVGTANRTHLVQHHGYACASELPGGLAPGETAADHVRWRCHAGSPELIAALDR
jgi:hypothetical protein